MYPDIARHKGRITARPSRRIAHGIALYNHAVGIAIERNTTIGTVKNTCFAELHGATTGGRACIASPPGHRSRYGALTLTGLLVVTDITTQGAIRLTGPHLFIYSTVTATPNNGIAVSSHAVADIDGATPWERTST